MHIKCENEITKIYCCENEITSYHDIDSEWELDDWNVQGCEAEYGYAVIDEHVFFLVNLTATK